MQNSPPNTRIAYIALLRQAARQLPPGDRAGRRALYERARQTLATRLRAVEPALQAREITSRRLMFEECIRQVEEEIVLGLMPAAAGETGDRQLQD